MEGLCNLPDEIILLTTERLNVSDLAALALSCRRLKAVSEYALYMKNRQYDRSSAVTWAAKHGNTATLDKALEHRLDMDEADLSTELTPLQTAVRYGRTSAVAWLLDHGSDVTREVPPRSSCRCRGVRTSILHVALCFGHVSVAHLLISEGAPLEYPPSYHKDLSPKFTDALVEASSYGLDTVVEVLIKDHGMDPQKPRGSRRDDVLVCAAKQNENWSTIRTLVALGANVNGIHKQWILSPLHVAIDAGNFNIAHTLLDLGANITSYKCEVEVENEGGEGMICETREVNASPLHDTIASICSRSTRDRLGVYSLCSTEEAESWRAERVEFMQRLIKLGIDIDMKYTGEWDDDKYEDITPLGLASAVGALQDMEYLIALGAKVESKMIKDALGGFDFEDEAMKKIKLLLKHGARLDERLRGGMSVLQLAVETPKGCASSSTLHDVLLMSSPKNLHSERLDEALEERLGSLDYITSIVLIRHGARVSCKDRLSMIATHIARGLAFNTTGVDDLEDIDGEMMYRADAPRDCMAIIINMGLDIAHQCVIFQTVLRKRQPAVAHLFLDRGLAGRPEAFSYLPNYLILATLWGEICVIRRLWQDTYKFADTNLRILLMQYAIISHNGEAVSFFMDHGAAPFERLRFAQYSPEGHSGEDSIKVQVDLPLLRKMDPESEGSSDLLCVDKKHKKTRILGMALSVIDKAQILSSPFQLAVRYGHIDIVSGMLENVNEADTDAISRCGKVYIPCVLEKANEIREMIQKKGIECEGGNSNAT
ncbi:hypothetical protein diail_7724 [Diaporthe ilicicola]|nr:hypothetical protein diail_7724 [Diaporthe ilicicola]